MKYPLLAEIPQTVSTVRSFGGYNHGAKIGDGEFYEMNSLSPDAYPALTVRKKRGFIQMSNQSAAIVTNLLAVDNLLVWCSMSKLRYIYYSDGSSTYFETALPAGVLLPSSGARVVAFGRQVLIYTGYKKGNAQGYPTALYVTFSGKKLSENFTVIEDIPLMDHMTECGNRMWGCRCGSNQEGVYVNEIYASELGDLTKWYTYTTASTASYAASIGVPGEFTGAINFGGYPTFFKEDCILRVYGSYPSQYQINTTVCSGVQSGSHGSLAFHDGILYYKGKSAVYAYDGSMPVPISSALGDRRYYYACGAFVRSKYYISMLDEQTDECSLFVYDTPSGLWHREDFTDIKTMAAFADTAVYVPVSAYNVFCTVTDEKLTPLYGGTSDNAAAEKKVKWSAQTGIIGADDPANKYISQIVIRARLGTESRLSVSVQYDSAGPWLELIKYRSGGTRSVNIPIRPRRCDHMRLRLSGEGDAVIYSISKIMSAGSYVNRPRG